LYASSQSVNDQKKLSQFIQKYRLMNSVTESFNTTMTQMTETSQKKMTDMSEQKKTSTAIH